MPSFTGQRPDLLGNGPIVDVQISVTAAAEDALQKAGQPVPAPVTILGLFDTGASGTCIKAGILAPLGLQPTGVRHINTPSSTNLACPEYAVRLVLPNNIVTELAVIEAPLQGQNIEGLLGRDVLSEAVFVYIGYAGTFSFSI